MRHYVTKIHPKLRLLNTAGLAQTGSALFPFAYEEVMGRAVGEGDLPLIHIWRHERAFIMGLRDRKLPHANEAMAWLKQQGYSTIVRHSGGAAVPLDSGVVNVSIIWPKRAHQMDFRADFDMMVSFMRDCLYRYTSEIDTGEIKGSYCPGEYDLSIKGLKFCGISQRRQTRSFIVQAFVVVEGSGVTRGQVAQQFYRIASGPKSSRDSLSINPAVMGSLSELVQLHNVDQFVTAVKQTISTWGSDVFYSEDYDRTINEQVAQTMATLRQRYDRQ